MSISTDPAHPGKIFEHDLGAEGDEITGDAVVRPPAPDPEAPPLPPIPDAERETGDPIADQAVIADDWGRVPVERWQHTEE